MSAEDVERLSHMTRAELEAQIDEHVKHGAAALRAAKILDEDARLPIPEIVIRVRVGRIRRERPDLAMPKGDPARWSPSDLLVYADSLTDWLAGQA